MWRPVRGKQEGLGIALAAFGGVAGLVGVYLASYTDCPAFGEACTHPYGTGGFPLEVLGLGFLGIGVAIWTVAFLLRPRPPRMPYPADPDELTVVPIGPSGGVIALQGMRDGFDAGLRDRESSFPVCPHCGVRLPQDANACPQCGHEVDTRLHGG